MGHFLGFFEKSLEMPHYKFCMGKIIISRTFKIGGTLIVIKNLRTLPSGVAIGNPVLLQVRWETIDKFPNSRLQRLRYAKTEGKTIFFLIFLLFLFRKMFKTDPKDHKITINLLLCEIRQHSRTQSKAITMRSGY